MRIFLICQQALQAHPVPAYDFWERYFKEGLRESNHTVFEADRVDWAEGLTTMSEENRSRWLERTWSKTIDAIKNVQSKGGLDLVLAYLFPNQVEPAAIQIIQGLGVPCVNFFCDNVREFSRVPEVYRAFALHWVPEAEARALYTSAGLRFVYAPMPGWVPPDQRQLPSKETDGITFIGSHDVLREALLGEAVSRGLPLNLYGPGWAAGGVSSPTSPSTFGQKIARQVRFLGEYGLLGLANKLSYKFHPCPSPVLIKQSLCSSPSTGDAYFHLISEGTVTLGINRYPSYRHSFKRPHTYSRLRDIEAPMLGACYLTEAAPGIEDLYDIGTEIETYRTVTELVEKAKELSADPKRRRQLREHGQQRALAEHTIARSIEKIAHALG